MKKILYVFLVVGILGLFILIFAYINQDKLIDRFIENQTEEASVDNRFLEDTEGIRLVTVGTSSPLPSDRAQSCNAVFVNGKFFVFDVGEGASAMIERLGLPLAQVDGIFISHWHSDHFIDLPNVINRSWLYGRKRPLHVYGPNPIDSVLQGIELMLRSEQEYRSNHHGERVLDPSIANAIAKPINTTSTSREVVFEEDGVTISAFNVDETKSYSSLGFRIDFNGLSLVISGDTKKSQKVIENAQGADLLVHEAMQTDFIARAAKLQEENGNDRNVRLLEDIVNSHSSPIDAAEVAQAAGVKKLVLNNLAPIPENPISRRFFLKGMADIFKGQIVLAKDGEEHYIN